MRIPLAVVFCVALAPALAWGQSDERAAMLSWINADRAADGRSALAPDRRLDAVADAHARDMAAHRFFSHTSPSTGAPADRAAAAGITFRLLAENIALNQSVRAAHEALMRSPGHRANLLNGSLRRVGIGLVRGPDGVYVTQLFATLPGDAAGAAPSPVSPIAPDDSATRCDAPDAPPQAPPQALDALPALVDPRRLGTLLTEAHRRAGALARPSPRGRAGHWTAAPFDLLRVVIPASPSPRRVDDDVSDDGADDDAPCAR